MNSTPAQRRVDQLVGLDRGRAEVLPDQVGALRLDDLGHLEQAEGVEDLGRCTRATVVLPVPGGPRKTKCRIGLSVVTPATARRRAASMDAAIERTCSLTAASPIIASSSAMASSMEICGRGAAGALSGRGIRSA